MYLLGGCREQVGWPGVGVAHVDFEMPITQPRDSWKRGET